MAQKHIDISILLLRYAAKSDSFIARFGNFGSSPKQPAARTPSMSQRRLGLLRDPRWYAHWRHVAQLPPGSARSDRTPNRRDRPTCRWAGWRQRRIEVPRNLF